MLPSSSSKVEVKEVASTPKMESEDREEPQIVVSDSSKRVDKSPMVKPSSSLDVKIDVKSLDEPSESPESESKVVQNDKEANEVKDEQDTQSDDVGNEDVNEDIDTENENRKYVEKAIKRGELKPLYDDWKESDGVEYNIYVTSPKESANSNGFTPPLVPSVSTVEVNGNPVTIILPNGAEGYVATQGEDSSIEYQPIDTTNNLVTPPTIGE